MAPLSSAAASNSFMPSHGRLLSTEIVAEHLAAVEKVSKGSLPQKDNLQSCRS